MLPIGLWYGPPGYSDNKENDSEGDNEQHNKFLSSYNSPRTLPVFDPERFHLLLRNNTT